MKAYKKQTTVGYLVTYYYLFANGKWFSTCVSPEANKWVVGVDVYDFVSIDDKQECDILEAKSAIIHNIAKLLDFIP